MKGLIGLLIIYLSFLIAGTWMNTWPFKYGNDGLFIFVIFNSVLLVLLLLSAKIVNRYKKATGVIVVVAWILLSTVYGIIKMHVDFNANASGFFRWDFALWEFGIPLFIGVPQILFIVCHSLIRAYIDDPQVKTR
ncbi:hypothetical protein FPL14_01550 [Cohnella cholangitidis]|uniref:Uncharacterized protein n=2 Tax=Cohnella cholangitidis TaxID=2598458 RepID=A0A7G5BSU6_9BACL|nr:hypothetical protein FPL14_01550 [Cohnella cholangitidis]